MYICCCLSRIVAALLIHIFINSFMSECARKTYQILSADKIYCPFIETLSFGSDIDIKCNNTYLMFNETSPDNFNWKFANQTSMCNQSGMQNAYIGQCGVKRINSNYLKVQLKSSKYDEKACVYCRINYKRIEPFISVTQSTADNLIFYTFNITTTKLSNNESFEILSVKRVRDQNRHSINYWISSKCIHSTIYILENTPHSITFHVEDVAVNRVEFIIRRCNDTCRSYDTCEDEEFLKDVATNYLKTPDSIEKLTCDSDCLNQASSTEVTDLPLVSILTQSTTKTSLTPEQSMEQIAKLLIIIVLLIVLLIILVMCTVHKIKVEKKHTYSKTNTTEVDA